MLRDVDYCRRHFADFTTNTPPNATPMILSFTCSYGATISYTGTVILYFALSPICAMLAHAVARHAMPLLMMPLRFMLSLRFS